MTTSLGRRIFRTFFINSLISLAVVIVFIWLVFSDMEDAVLTRNAREQMNLLQRDEYLKTHFNWHSGTFTAHFRPNNHLPPDTPPLFRGVSVPFSGEITWNGGIYFIYSAADSDGNYFLAIDISDFERREALFGTMLGVLAIIVLVLNLVLAMVANRRLVRPLQQLTYLIRQVVPSGRLDPIVTDYSDAELMEIANAFNWFIREISALIQRERTMISLAGHELKTPIAVISGAIEIMEQRNQLTGPDKKTFSRIKVSTQEMKENVETLLTLSRRAKSQSPHQEIVLDCFLDGLIEEIGFVNPGDYERIQKQWQSDDIKLLTDPVMAKLLLRNLIRNALSHTQGPIRLYLTHRYLDILDQGAGLPIHVDTWIKQQPGELPVQEGLGLYLVTLACEYLGWELTEAQEAGWTHGFRLSFQPIAAQSE